MAEFTIDDFEFTPEEGFLDASAYPDPSTETQVRTQLMSLHNQIKEYLNTTVKTALISIAGSQGDPEAIQEIMDALADLDDIVGTLPADVTALQNRVADLETSHTTTAFTMNSADWSGSTFSFEDDYPSSDYDIEIALDGDESDAAEYAAWSAAQILGSATSNVVTALGTVPAINLHVIVKAVTKV
ncbi:MAG: hypothetical protein K6E41_04490 [Solobacterium sp.]|nr:hypothetical protein [Solobacterium sp.]